MGPDIVRCEGYGQLAKNFGIHSPGRPEIVDCPGCPDCQPRCATCDMLHKPEDCPFRGKP